VRQRASLLLKTKTGTSSGQWSMKTGTEELSSTAAQKLSYLLLRTGTRWSIGKRLGKMICFSFQTGNASASGVGRIRAGLRFI
jgi:hypothetical protein